MIHIRRSGWDALLELAKEAFQAYVGAKHIEKNIFSKR